jgi:hypothetical protein
MIFWSEVLAEPLRCLVESYQVEDRSLIAVLHNQPVFTNRTSILPFNPKLVSLPMCTCFFFLLLVPTNALSYYARGGNRTELTATAADDQYWRVWLQAYQCCQPSPGSRLTAQLDGAGNPHIAMCFGPLSLLVSALSRAGRTALPKASIKVACSRFTLCK